MSRFMPRDCAQVFRHVTMRICPGAHAALRRSTVLVLAAWCIAFVGECRAQTRTWTGAGDGTTFGMASNWSPAGVPNTANDCVIPTGATTVQITNNYAVKSLTTARKVVLGGCCTFTLTAGMQLQSGAIFQLANTGGCSGLIFQGGPQSISGDGEIAVVNMGTNGSGILIVNNTAVTITSGVRVTFGPAATGTSASIEVQSGCTLTNQGEISISKNNATFSIWNNGTFVNQGTLSVSAGTLKLFTGTWSNSGTFSPSGTGTLSLAGQFSSLGPISRSGGTLIVGGQFTGPELTATAATGEIVLAAADFTGVTLRGDGAALRGHGNSSLRHCSARGDVKLTGGTWTIREGLELRDNATLALPGSGSPRLLFVGGVQDVWGSGTISDPEISVDPGTSVTVAASVQIAFGEGGANPVRGDGGFFVDTGATLKTLGPITLQGPYSTLSVSGTGVYTNAGSISAGDTNSVKLLSDNWVNAGTISGNGAFLTFAGRFSALGAVTRVGGTVMLSGTCVGPEVRATAGIGNISLGDLVATGVLFAADGANAFTIDGEVSLTGCTLAANATIRYCSDLIVRSGLAFSGGATLLLSGECANASITFDGGTQLVSGSGTIQRGSGLDPDITIKNNATVTLGTEIVIRVRSIVIESGSQLINSGEIVNDVSGSRLTISGAGAFTNSGLLSAAGAGITLSAAAWINNGVFAVSGTSFFSLQGTYSSLGTIQRTGGTLELMGTFTGTALNATAATGDLQLANVTLTGVALSSSGGAKLLQKFGSGILDACSITGEMIIGQGGQCNVRNGLTLLSGATITIDSTDANSSASFHPFGGAQTIGGTGIIQFASTIGNAYFYVQTNAIVTIDSGVVVRNKGGSTGSKVGQFILNENSVLTLRGQVISDVAGRSMLLMGFFGGKLINQGLLAADGAALEVSPPFWSSEGVFSLQNAGTLTLGGAYSTMGSFVRTGGTLILNGTATNLNLSTVDVGGDLVLGAVTVTNSTLRAIGASHLIVRGSSTLDGCTIGGTLENETCSSLTIQNGLTLDNATVIYTQKSGGCSTANGRLLFSGSPQTFGGTGTVQLGGGVISTVDNMTIAPSISISIGAPGRAANGTISVTGTLNCYAPIVMNAPTATMSINGNSSSRFVNLGSIDLLAGSLNLACLWGSTGNFTIAPAAKVTLGGTYAIDTDLAVVSGGSLTFGGNWVNNAQISSNGGNVAFGGTWTNAGLFDISNSTWRIGDSYTSLGAHTGSNNVLTYAGALPVNTLVADATTGDITLSGLAANGVTFRAQDGKKFTLSASSAWTGCTLDADLLISGCTTLSVLGGLTLQHAATITVDYTCFTTGLKLTADAQTGAGLLGEGRVRINRSSTVAGVSFEGANQIIPAGITIEMPSDAAATSTAAAIASTLTVTNRGTIAVGRAGGTFAWTGGSLVNQGLLRITAGKLDIASLSGPIGNVQLDPGASLTLGGTYTVDNDLAALAGGKLTLNGTWTNTAAISSLNSTLILGGTWSNSGTLSVSNSAWTIGGVYPSLGNWSGGNNTLTYAGTYPGTTLAANASTGDITLSTVTFKNAILSAADGAKFVFAQNATVTLNTCDLATDLLVGPCAALVVTGPLNLLNNPTIRLASGGCNLTPLTFATTNSTISGAGKILMGINTANTVINLSSANATFGPDLFVGFDLAQPSTKSTVINIGSNRTLTLQGMLSADQINRTLTVGGGGGTFTNAGTARSTAGTLSIAPTTISNLPSATSVLTGGKWLAAGGALTLGSRTIWSIAPGTELQLTGPSITTPNLTGLRSNSGKLLIESRTLATTPSTGSFSNSGELDLGPGGTLSVTGSATLVSGSTLVVPVRGVGPTQRGNLAATGSIALGGRLLGSFESPYQPVEGDVIPGVLVAPAITGALDSVCFADNPSGLGAVAQLDSGAVPMSLNLIVTSGAGLSPKFSQQPSDTSASPIAHFQVAAGPSGVTYRWLKDSVPLNDGVSAGGSILSGAMTPALTITNVVPEDAGSYRCSATNSCGIVASDPAFLILCSGDLNADNMVDDADFVLFLVQYNILDCGDPTMRPGCSADLNSDGMVDDADFQVFVPAYEQLVCF